jgi:sulfite exporter TauE/SafE
MQPDYDVVAMIALGLTGTGHCLGMCGPLVVAIPGPKGQWSAHLAYHAGRLITYTLIGMVLGALSAGFVRLTSSATQDPMIWITRLQMLITAAAALFLVVLGAQRLGLIREPRWMAVAQLNSIPGVGNALSRMLHNRDLGSIFILGLALGLLPCGLSYAAFTRALASSDMVNGGLLTFCFGIGTLPGLLLLGTGAGALWRRHRMASDIISGLIMIAMGVSLIVRITTTI